MIEKNIDKKACKQNQLPNMIQRMLKRKVWQGGPNLRRGVHIRQRLWTVRGSKFANGFGPGSISRGSKSCTIKTAAIFFSPTSSTQSFFHIRPILHRPSVITSGLLGLQYDYKHFKLKRENFAFICHISQEYEKVNLVHLFVVLSSCGVSISMISISLDVRKVQKSYVLANVNVDGKHLKQIKKINIPQHSLIVHCGNSV